MFKNKKTMGIAIAALLVASIAGGTVAAYAANTVDKQSVVNQEENYDQIKSAAIGTVITQTAEELAQGKADKIEQLEQDGRTDVIDEINTFGQYKSRGAMREAMDSSKTN